MPKTPADKIAAIEARMKARKEKLASIKIVQSIEAADRKDQEALEEAKTEAAKEKAAKKREADSGSKVLLGVGVQKFPEPIRSRTVVTLLPLLDERDRDRLRPWIALRAIDLNAPPLGIEITAKTSLSAPEAPSKAADPVPVVPPQTESAPDAAKSEPPTPATEKTPATDDSAVVGPPKQLACVDPTAAAVMDALEHFEPGILSMMEPEFLNASQGDNRRLLEQLFARLHKGANVDLPPIEVRPLEREKEARPMNG